MTSKQERQRLEALDARSREELAKRKRKPEERWKPKEMRAKMNAKDAAKTKPPER